MSGSVKYRPVVLIRRVLLGALALFLGVVVAQFVYNRIGAGEGPEAARETELDSRLADIILSGKGFDYEVTDGAERLFHIRADRILADRENVMTLRGIQLTMERKDGSAYTLAAENGRYHTETNTAEVEGGVVFSGADGIELRGERFELVRKGTVVKSRSPVEFSVENRLSGEASVLEAYLKKDRFQLSGKVRIFGTGSLSLSAKRILYEKRSEQIHAEGGVVLDRGRDRLASERIAVTLDESGNASFVRARWGVIGTLVSDDPRGFERRVEFTGDEVSLAYESGRSEPRLAEIVGTARIPARFEQTDDTGLVRRFVTDRVEARFQDGQVRQASTGGPVIVFEFLRFDAENEIGRACGDSATASFGPLGALVELVLDQNVNIHRGGFQASGDRVVARGDNRIEVRGAPAHVYTRRGELSAPELDYLTNSGNLTARKGVRALFPPQGDFTMVQATESSEDKPIQVTSETAEWSQAGDTFQFDGSVRAWQGDSFLSAKRLIGEGGDRLRAEGGIKTVLERTPSEGDGESENGPVEVTADTLSYSRAASKIEYRGTPEVRDSGRHMSCSELDVLLGEASKLSSLACRGNTFIDDRLGGYKVRGSEALYLPDDSKVEVWGSPAVLENPEGGVIQAGRVIYDFESATAQFQSGSTSKAAEAVKTPKVTDG